MPLPNGSTEWPPARVDGLRQDMAEWAVWYAGDPDQLTAFYDTTARAMRANTRPAQYQGGVVGRLARWWWGVPTAQGEQPTKLHVPLASDICATSADLLFSESPKLSSSSESLQEFLDGLQDDGLPMRLHEGAEVQAALGGVYLRNSWDRDLGPRPWTDVIHADMALPEWRQGRLWAVTFWQVLPRLSSDSEGTVWRLLERHEAGRIEHGLYQGSTDNLGTRVPLQEHPSAEYLAKLVDAESGYATGVDRLTAQYVPNMLPNRLHRGSRQGRSDLQSLPPLLDALDEAYSSWLRDIRHAKSRIHVPASMLESYEPGKPAVADIDREVYVPVQGMLAKGDNTMDQMIQAQQFAIRFAEHSQTCAEWTKTIVESAGYSTQSLTGDGGGAVTAAEVHSHERRSYMTRGKKIRYWQSALRDHLVTQAELANANLRAGLALDTVDIEFEDGVQDTLLELAQTAQTMRVAESASTETLVRLLHPGWDKDAIDAEVAAILSESGTGAPVPVPGDNGL